MVRHDISDGTPAQTQVTDASNAAARLRDEAGICHLYPTPAAVASGTAAEYSDGFLPKKVLPYGQPRFVDITPGDAVGGGCTPGDVVRTPRWHYVPDKPVLDAPLTAAERARVAWLEEQARMHPEIIGDFGPLLPGQTYADQQRAWYEEQVRRERAEVGDYGALTPGEAAREQRILWLEEQAARRRAELYGDEYAPPYYRVRPGQTLGQAPDGDGCAPPYYRITPGQALDDGIPPYYRINPGQALGQLPYGDQGYYAQITPIQPWDEAQPLPLPFHQHFQRGFGGGRHRGIGDALGGLGQGRMHGGRMGGIIGLAESLIGSLAYRNQYANGDEYDY
ncbi:MAG TPA: hypothetical protein V6C81_01075 [Planktothrix sp.]|jgi:hypothetical protein